MLISPTAVPNPMWATQPFCWQWQKPARGNRTHWRERSSLAEAMRWFPHCHVTDGVVQSLYRLNVIPKKRMHHVSIEKPRRVLVGCVGGCVGRRPGRCGRPRGCDERQRQGWTLRTASWELQQFLLESVQWHLPRHPPEVLPVRRRQRRRWKVFQHHYAQMPKRRAGLPVFQRQ